MPGNPLTDPNWAIDLADTIVRVVGGVRDKATDKAVMAVRAMVFGIVIGMAAVATLVLALILGTRFVQVVISRIARTDPNSTVWISYMVMGVLLLLSGMVCMRLRRSKPEPA